MRREAREQSSFRPPQKGPRIGTILSQLLHYNGMKLPGVEGSTRNKLFAALLIAAGAVVVSVILNLIPTTHNGLAILDNVFYDWFYQLRPIESQQDQPIVIVAIDDNSLKYINKELKMGWPWPRQFYGMMAEWLGNAGAKARICTGGQSRSAGMS